MIIRCSLGVPYEPLRNVLEESLRNHVGILKEPLRTSLMHLLGIHWKFNRNPSGIP
jgi:hypothetical protein